MSKTKLTIHSHNNGEASRVKFSLFQWFAFRLILYGIHIYTAYTFVDLSRGYAWNIRYVLLPVRTADVLSICHLGRTSSHWPNLTKLLR